MKYLGRAPGGLVAHQAAVQGVVDVVCFGHVRHEVGGRAAGEEKLLARGQVVGAHDVPRVRRQGQGVAVHAHSRGVRGQDHAAAAAGRAGSQSGRTSNAMCHKVDQQNDFCRCESPVDHDSS